MVIALLSIPVFVIYRVIRNAKVLTILRCIFSTGLVIWATFFLETWKRRNANVNIQWGVHDYHEETAEETRAQFEGELRNGFYCEGGFVSLDDMTDMTSAQESAQILLRPGRESIILPQNKYENPAFARNAQLVSIAVTVLFVVLVGCLTFLLLRFRNEVVTQGAKLTGLQFANAIPGILNGVLITVFDAIWRAVSMSLTRRENHRTTQRFENSLIYKRFAFQFVSNCKLLRLCAVIVIYETFYVFLTAFLRDRCFVALYCVCGEVCEGQLWY